MTDAEWFRSLRFRPVVRTPEMLKTLTKVVSVPDAAEKYVGRIADPVLDAEVRYVVNLGERLEREQKEAESLSRLSRPQPGLSGTVPKK